MYRPETKVRETRKGTPEKAPSARAWTAKLDARVPASEKRRDRGAGVDTESTSNLAIIFPAAPPPLGLFTFDALLKLCTLLTLGLLLLLAFALAFVLAFMP